MIKLNRTQYRKLNEALVGAFTLPALRRMLTFQLDRDLEAEAGGSDSEEVVFNLIGKAQQKGWLADLITAAVAENPTAVPLRQIAAELQPAIDEDRRDHFNVTFVGKNLALVNRRVLRDALRELSNSELMSARILVVNGPPVSGKSYSIELISYLLRALQTFRLVWIDLKTIPGEVRPEHVAGDIVEQMRLDPAIVPPVDQEQNSRWIQSFCNRLQGALGGNPDPWWVVMDGFNHISLSPSVNDLVKELCGRARLTLPGLRVVLLSYPDLLTSQVEKVALRETIAPINERDLTEFFSQVYRENKRTHFPRDIAERIGEVLRAVDPNSVRYVELLGAEVAKVASTITV